MKVFYQRTYSIAPYLTERIGFEVDTEIDSLMPDGSKINPDTAVQSLKELCDKAHKELNPNLEEMKGTHVVPVQEKEVSPDQSLIDTINYCTTTRSVEMFRKEVERRNNPLITEAFENKLKSLQP